LRPAIVLPPTLSDVFVTIWGVAGGWSPWWAVVGGALPAARVCIYLSGLVCLRYVWLPLSLPLLPVLLLRCRIYLGF